MNTNYLSKNIFVLDSTSNVSFVKVFLPSQVFTGRVRPPLDVATGQCRMLVSDAYVNKCEATDQTQIKFYSRNYDSSAQMCRSDYKVGQGDNPKNTKPPTTQFVWVKSLS